MTVKRINVLFYIGILACFLLISQGLDAQDQTPQDTAEIAQPKAISLLDLSAETERIREDVNLARNRMPNEASIRRIDSLFSDFLITLEDGKKDYAVFRQVTPNRQKLDNMIYKWSGHSYRLNGWQRTLNRYQSRNLLGLNTLEEDLESWELTAATVIQEDIPLSVSESISKSIEELNGIITDIKNQNNRILTVETQIVEQKNEITQLIVDLETWIQSAELKVTNRRHEPIWQTSFKRSEEDKARMGENSFMEELRLIPGFFYTYEHDLNVYALWILLIIGLVFYLRKRMQDLDVSERDRRVQRLKEIITKDAIATVSFLIILAVIIFLTNLPQLLSGLLVIGMLVSALILLRPFAYREFKWLVFFVIIAYVLEAIKMYFWFSSANYRVYMFGQTLFAFVIIGYYIMQRKKVAKLVMGSIGKTIYQAIPLLIVIYVTALLANILGYTNLSDLMLKVGTMGAVITVVTYGILIVFGGIFAAAIVLYFKNKPDSDISHHKYVQKRAQEVVGVFAVIFWIVYFLIAAELYRPFVKSSKLWLSEPWKFGDMSVTPENILSFVLVIVGTFLITRIISELVQGGIMRPLRLSRGVPSAVSLVLRYFIIVFGVVFSLGVLGVDLTGFSLMAGALGVGIGFGLQNIISNFVAGIILTFERPILPGDTVEVGTTLGVVDRIGVRSSHVRTFDGADVVVPNNNLLSNELTNWTQSDNKKRVEIRIGAAYGTDPNDVLNILRNAAMDYEHTVKEPPPLPLFEEFADSSLNFRLLFWVPVDSVLGSKSDVSIEIYNRFAEAGIKIPFPQQDVNIIQPDSDEA